MNEAPEDRRTISLRIDLLITKKIAECRTQARRIFVCAEIFQKKGRENRFSTPRVSTYPQETSFILGIPVMVL